MENAPAVIISETF